MSICTNRIYARLKRLYPRTQQWLWFAGLWLLGLGSVLLLTIPIKLLIKACQ
jgi:hypothetical protein